MHQINKDNIHLLQQIFADTDNMFALSFFQGYFDGQGWVDCENTPRAGRIIVAGVCILAGDHTSPGAESLICDITDKYNGWEMIPPNAEWEGLIHTHCGDKYQKKTRYGFVKDMTCFDRDKLQAFVDALPSEFRIVQIDEAIYHARAGTFAHHLCSNFPTAQDYAKRGLGFVVMLGDEIVSGASSYISCAEGIEIQIDTRHDYMRKGLATAVAARLILKCLDRNWNPTWDAATPISLALAEKLGYRFDKQYTAYGIVVK